MIFSCQSEPLDELSRLAETNRQSILIEGPIGCGKTYMSHQYANMLNIDDFILVQPKVNDIREALDSSIQVSNKVVLCIENLDTGVLASAYTLLKALEEPQPNVYIIITARNLKMVPDTIISRSAVVRGNPPMPSDIESYGSTKDKLKYNNVKDRLVWKCAKSFTDADEILNMSIEQITYYESLSQLCTFEDNISGLIWTLGHYPDNQPCNIELAIRSVMELMKNPFVTKCGIECLTELSGNRIAQHAVLAKFAFNAKYCE